MTFTQEFAITKLTSFKGYQLELSSILQSSDRDSMASQPLFHAIERLFQLMVDAMIDINQHFIRELELEIPEDFFSTFTALGQHGILQKEFALKLAPIVGVRNRLVHHHQYEKVDRALFISNLRKNFTDFDSYQYQIKKYLERNETSGDNPIGPN